MAADAARRQRACARPRQTTLGGIEFHDARLALHTDPVYVQPELRFWSFLNCRRRGEHCEAAMWMDTRLSLGPHDGPPEPPTPDELRHDMTGPSAQLCTEGVADGCIHLVGMCTDRACIDERAARLQEAGVDASPLRAAWQAVDVACTTGDVDACESAGRPLPKAELCAAGDEDACGHDPGAIIKAMQAEVATLVTSCRANDRAACDRLTALTASDCK